MMEPKVPRMAVKRNAAQCLHCGDIIESKSHHDWISCRCYNLNLDEPPFHGVYVDGGFSYCRHGWCNADEYVNLCEFTEDTMDAE